MYHNEAATGAAINSYLQSHASSGLTRADIWYTTKLLTNSTYSAAASSIAHSVKVSGLGYVDLFLLHAPYGGPRARAEAWRAVSDAVRAGTVRAGGVSNFSERHIEQLLASGPDVLPPAVNQVEIHPFNTRADLAKFCQARGIAVQAFCPLTRAEKLRDPRMAVLARKYKCTPAQLCVRWSRQHGYIPLPKSANKGRLVENAAINGFEISKEDMEQMDGFDEGYVLGMCSLIIDRANLQTGIRTTHLEQVDVPVVYIVTRYELELILAVAMLSSNRLQFRRNPVIRIVGLP